jgi:hypothetical protein
MTKSITITVLTLALGLALSACASNLESSAQCARTAGCTSSFPSSGYGPIQAQAAEPTAAPSWQTPH